MALSASEWLQLRKVHGTLLLIRIGFLPIFLMAGWTFNQNQTAPSIKGFRQEMTVQTILPEGGGPAFTI